MSPHKSWGYKALKTPPTERTVTLIGQEKLPTNFIDTIFISLVYESIWRLFMIPIISQLLYCRFCCFKIVYQHWFTLILIYFISVSTLSVVCQTGGIIKCFPIMTNYELLKVRDKFSIRLIKIDRPILWIGAKIVAFCVRI